MANTPVESPISTPSSKKNGSVPKVRSSHLPENMPIKMEPTNCDRIADMSAIA